MQNKIHIKGRHAKLTALYIIKKFVHKTTLLPYSKPAMQQPVKGQVWDGTKGYCNQLEKCYYIQSEKTNYEFH